MWSQQSKLCHQPATHRGQQTNPQKGNIPTAIFVGRSPPPQSCTPSALRSRSAGQPDPAFSPSRTMKPLPFVRDRWAGNQGCLRTSTLSARFSSLNHVADGFACCALRVEAVCACRAGSSFATSTRPILLGRSSKAARLLRSRPGRPHDGWRRGSGRTSTGRLPNSRWRRLSSGGVMRSRHTVERSRGRQRASSHRRRSHLRLWIHMVRRVCRRF